jgi:hypothetical protein
MGRSANVAIPPTGWTRTLIVAESICLQSCSRSAAADVSLTQAVSFFALHSRSLSPKAALSHGRPSPALRKSLVGK